MIKVDIPQIHVSQEQGSVRDKQYLAHFPTSKIYGLVGYKTLDYAARHHFLNKVIRDVYIEHGLGKATWEKNEFYYYDLKHYTHKINIETIIYWLRKNSDDVICLLYFSEYRKKHQKDPENIEVDSIGKLLGANPGPDFKSSIANHLGFLKILNEVSNAYKHSFINSNEAGGLIGAEEPSVVALQMKYNNNAKYDTIYHSHSLRLIIDSYTAFFENAATILGKTRFWE